VNESTDWPGAAIAITGIIFVMTVASVAIWQIFGTWRARKLVAREDAYRTLAADATAAQQRFATVQQEMATDLADLRARVTAIEALLREVG